VEYRSEKDKRMLVDRYGRVIDYLRISVTDRCNMRCIYCMPHDGVPFIPHRRILRYEEIVKIADIFLDLGIRKIRITGGEPLVRRNIQLLFKELGNRERLRELTLTTNGKKLAEHIPDLLEAGIKRVNVSLDSLRKETYEYITGTDDLQRVIQGIKSAQMSGLKVKLNTVVMKGINDGELTDIMDFGIKNSCDVRFIEVMPQIYNDRFAKEMFLSADDVLNRMKQRYTLTALKTTASSTERLFQIEECSVCLGIISPLSHPFCNHCNKVRLMPDGTLRTCLFSKQGLHLKEMLEQNVPVEEIKKEIAMAVFKKPQSHLLEEEKGSLVMHRMGG